MLRRVFGLLTAMILKRASESIFFHSNKFTACKVKDEKIGGELFDGVQSIEEYPSTSSLEAFKDLVKLRL